MPFCCLTLILGVPFTAVRACNGHTHCKDLCTQCPTSGRWPAAQKKHSRRPTA